MNLFWRMKMRNLGDNTNVGPAWPLTIVSVGSDEIQVRNPEGEVLYSAFFEKLTEYSRSYRDCESFARRYNLLKRTSGERADWYDSDDFLPESPPTTDLLADADQALADASTNLSKLQSLLAELRSGGAEVL